MDQDHVVLLWASPPVPLSNLLMVVTSLIGRPATSAQLIRIVCLALRASLTQTVVVTSGLGV